MVAEQPTEYVAPGASAEKVADVAVFVAESVAEFTPESLVGPEEPESVAELEAALPDPVFEATEVDVAAEVKLDDGNDVTTRLEDEVKGTTTGPGP